MSFAACVGPVVTGVEGLAGSDEVARGSIAQQGEEWLVDVEIRPSQFRLAHESGFRRIVATNRRTDAAAGVASRRRCPLQTLR